MQQGYKEDEQEKRDHTEILQEQGGKFNKLHCPLRRLLWHYIHACMSIDHDLTSTKDNKYTKRVLECQAHGYKSGL